MTIGKKIALIIGVMALLIAINSVIGMLCMTKVGKNADTLLHEAEIVDSIQEARLSFQAMLMPPTDYLITADEKDKESFEKLAGQTKDKLAKCAGLLQGHKHYMKREVDDRAVLNSIEKDFAAIEDMSREIFSMADPLTHKSGKVMEEMDNAVYKVAEELNKLEVLTRKLFSNQLTDTVHELNLSFHQLLMPVNDYLITGDKNEIEKFNELLTRTKGQMIGVSDLITENKALITGLEEKEVLENAQKDLARIEILAREILSVRDPLRVESSKKMEQIDMAADKASENLRQLAKAANETGRHDLASNIQRLRISFHKIIMPANDYLIHGDAGERDNFDKLLASAEGDMAAVSKQVDTGEEREILSRVDRELTIVASVSREILSMPDPLGKAGAEKAEQMDMIAGHLVEDLHSLLENAERDLKGAMAIADKVEAMSKMVSMIAPLILIIIGLGMGFGVSSPIVKSVAALVAGTKKIAGGDLTCHVEVKTKDELLELSDSFNQMTYEIQTRNEELQTMNEELHSTNEELESSNEELRSTTEELESSNEELRSTTEELEASNEELRTANEELESTQEKLVRQEKLAAVGQLAAGLGHELRNPLGVIKNAAYYIKTKVSADDPKLVKHLTIMEREINNSNRLINDLLGFSRTRPPAVAPSDINKIVGNAMEAVEVPKNVLLVTEFNTGLPKVMADADQMHQVFVNLGLNAIQAMAEGGQLKVKTNLADDYVKIEFEDTGCGIPQENISKLFDPFFSTKARGVGLGLAVTHGIVERHKGTIDLKSKVGAGTTFTVKLPIEKQTSEKEASDKQPVAVS